MASNKLTLASEKAILSAIVQKPNLIFDIDGISISSSDFGNEMLRQIYSGVKEIATTLNEEEGKQEIDPVVLEEKVANLFPTAYKQSKTDYGKAIRAISDFRATNIPEHIRIVALESAKKQVKIHVKNMGGLVDQYNNPVDLVQAIETKTFEFTSNQFNPREITHLGENFKDWISDLAIRAREDDIDLGFSSGFHLYDEAIGGGLLRGTVNIIAARPKRGKSFMALKISQNVAQQEIPVLYLDTELTKEIQYSRLAAMMTGVPVRSIKSGNFIRDHNHATRLRNGVQDITALPIHYIPIAGWTIEEQISIIRRWFSRVVGKDSTGKWNRALVVLDYLKLMNSSDKGADQEYEALGYRMTALHDLMVSFDAPMVAFAQQNREGADPTNAGAETVSGSDRIIWLCDSFSVLAQKCNEEMLAAQENLHMGDLEFDQYSTMRFTVSEGRHGPGTPGGRYISLYFDGKDPRISADNFCGVIREVGLEMPWQPEEEQHQRR